MSASRPPQIECTQIHPTLVVADVAAAARWYEEKLGFRTNFVSDDGSFGGVQLGSVSMHLQPGTPHPGGIFVYFVVEDADELFAFHRGNGVEVLQEPGDRPWGLRDYTVRDPDGNPLSFGHHLFNAGPPIEIERVDVPVRLEKRLAAVLADLAEHKRMSVSSTLEETLLHTFEPFGDSVASPHTHRTLRYIAELKQKHGIDYDSHGSYRFVESEGGHAGEPASAVPCEAPDQLQW